MADPLTIGLELPFAGIAVVLKLTGFPEATTAGGGMIPWKAILAGPECGFDWAKEAVGRYTGGAAIRVRLLRVGLNTFGGWDTSAFTP